MTSPRPQTATQLAGNRRAAPRQSVPREGTLTRRVYDAILSEEEFSIHEFNAKVQNIPTIFEYLRIFYGIEVTRVRVGYYKMK